MRSYQHNMQLLPGKGYLHVKKQNVKNESVGAHHVNAIEDLVSQIAGDAHVGGPCGGVEQHIWGLVLGLEVWVHLLAQQKEAIANGCPGDARAKAYQRKYQALVPKVEQPLAHAECALLEHVTRCSS